MLLESIAKVLTNLKEKRSSKSLVRVADLAEMFKNIKKTINAKMRHSFLIIDDKPSGSSWMDYFSDFATSFWRFTGNYKYLLNPDETLKLLSSVSSSNLPSTSEISTVSKPVKIDAKYEKERAHLKNMIKNASSNFPGLNAASKNSSGSSGSAATTIDESCYPALA